MRLFLERALFVDLKIAQFSSILTIVRHPDRTSGTAAYTKGEAQVGRQLILKGRLRWDGSLY